MKSKDCFVEKIVSDTLKSECDFIRLHIQEKPKWLPKFIWYWILKKIIVKERWISIDFHGGLNEK